MIVLGYASSGGVNDLPVAVYDGDCSATSRRFVSAVHQSHSFEVAELVDDVARAERMLERSEISILFIIPEGLERGLTGHNGDTSIAAVIDGSNIAVASYAASYAEGVIGHFTAQALGGWGDAPVSAEPRIWYNQELRRENFYIPALLGSMLSLVVLAITAVCIVRERERGTLEQLMVTPIRPSELIAGKLVPVVVIAYAELVLMLIIATRIFNVPIKGSLTLYVGLMLVYLLAEMGVGILISTVAGSQAQALPTIFLLVTMNGILAGFVSPVETMPLAVQRVSLLVPLRYFIEITRRLFAKGAGLQELVGQLFPLVAMALVFFVASTLLLRRRLA
jgi:ABC-2 type transport system permease protein